MSVDVSEVMEKLEDIKLIAIEFGDPFFIDAIEGFIERFKETEEL